MPPAVSDGVWQRENRVYPSGADVASGTATRTRVTLCNEETGDSMTDGNLADMKGRAQFRRNGGRESNRVERAVEAARERFRKSRPGTACQSHKLEDLAPGSSDSCQKAASWLAVYRVSPDEELCTAYLCRRCKEKVRQLLHFGDVSHHSFVLVQDWRLSRSFRTKRSAHA